MARNVHTLHIHMQTIHELVRISRARFMCARRNLKKGLEEKRVIFLQYEREILVLCDFDVLYYFFVLFFVDILND